MVNGNTVECFSCGINPVKNGLLVGMFESGFFVGFFVHFSLLDPGPNHWLMFVLKKVHFMRLNTVESGLLVGMFDCPVSLLVFLYLRRVLSDLLEDDVRVNRYSLSKIPSIVSKCIVPVWRVQVDSGIGLYRPAG